MNAPTWSPERLDVLRDLYVEQRLSAGQCAIRMKETRGSISGALHRFKIKRGIPRPPRQKWPKERVDELARLAADGFSGPAIADKLGCGKTTIARKAAELGITFTGTIRRELKPPKEPKAQPVARAPAPAPAAVRPPTLIASEPAAGGVTIDGLGAFTCRWPLGDARKEADGLQRFCGERIAFSPKRMRAPYCACHGAQAVAAVQPAKRVKPYEPNVIFRRPQREAA